MRNYKTGTLVSFSEYSVYNYFCDANLVIVQLRTQDGDIVEAEARPDYGFALDSFFMSQKVVGKEVLKIDNQARADLNRRHCNDLISQQIKPDSVYYSSNVRIRAAIGDVLRIGWDYGEFAGAIVEMAADRNNRMKWSHPVKKLQAFNEGAISSSFGGSLSDIKKATSTNNDDSEKE